MHFEGFEPINGRQIWPGKMDETKRIRFVIGAHPILRNRPKTPQTTTNREPGPSKPERTHSASIDT
eukprot:scaffold4990_cov89-Cylindrotheca_fusiformis.AAC.1